MKKKDLQYIINAHSNYPKKPSKAFRKCDGKTPYWVHPLWCATTIASETSLDEKTKQKGILTLLYHDILEDTTQEIPEWLPKRINYLVREMSFKNGSKQEMKEIWYKPKEIRLYKLYDKVNNLMDGSWMSHEKRKKYEDYIRKLSEDVQGNYDELNIIRIAEEIARGNKI